MLKQAYSGKDCSLYSIADGKKTEIDRFIATTQETRQICNDPFTVGVKYTRKLENACTHVFKALKEINCFTPKEEDTIVFNVLRGGLNFGLREALANAYGWNTHGSAFISAQRARVSHNSEQWHITESHYKKVYVPREAVVVLGDVVATGTSLQHAMNELVKSVKENRAQLTTLVFFTIGGRRSEGIVHAIDMKCRELFPKYEKSIIIYFEGRFEVANPKTELFIKITGTDLLRLNSLMAPEFIESQYESPSYAIERCTIYDAGSRAFWLPEYFEDLKEYWEGVLALAQNGTCYTELLKNRFSKLDVARFGDVDLAEVAGKQLDKVAL